MSLDELKMLAANVLKAEPGRRVIQLAAFKRGCSPEIIQALCEVAEAADGLQDEWRLHDDQPLPAALTKLRALFLGDSKEGR